MRCVGSVESFFEAADFDDPRHRAEDLLLSDPHGERHVVENGRGVEAAVAEDSVGQNGAADECLRAFGLSDTDVPMDAFQLFAVDDGADLRLGVDTDAHPQRAGTVYKCVAKRTLDIPVHDQAAGGGAALTGGPEGAPERALQREFYVRVVHHDDRILAAEFAADSLHELSAPRRDLPPDLP